MTKKVLPIILLVLTYSVFFSIPSFAQFDALKKNLGKFVEDPIGAVKQTSLSDTEIGQGLKEALKVGITNAVSSVSKDGGYFNNENIKIPLPEKLKFMDSSLRKIGMAESIDKFVLSMNQAAESAAPSALDLFLDALTEMNIEEVQKVYLGGDTAATDYFKEKPIASWLLPLDRQLTKHWQHMMLPINIMFCLINTRPSLL